MAWQPGDPWPPLTPGGTVTPGGAAAPRWGGYVRFWLRAGIAPGLAFHMGPHDQDRLDAGNVLGPAASEEGGGFLGDRLWIDLSCDVTRCEITGGATSGQGIFGKVDATTLQATLADPTGKYDPLFSGGPFAVGGRSRLVPSVPVEAFAEVVDPETSTVTRRPIFTGTADSWEEDWTPHSSSRVATLIASDQTKIWARYNREEQSPTGSGETVGQRVHRLVDFFAWPGDVVDPPGGSARTLAATTLAQPGWEMLNRAIDDELGAAYFTPAGELRWVNRETFTTVAPPRLALGCEEVDDAAHDVLVDASPAKFDLQMRNDVWAARSGGAQQHAFSQASIDQFGPYGHERTDLGLADDAQAAQWAAFVVQLYAFPQVGVGDLTLVPAADPASWALWDVVLDWQWFSDVVAVHWAPPDLPTHVIEGELRVVGASHVIERGRWEVTWQTIAARPFAYATNAFRMGPSATDRLDSNFILV